MPDLWLQQLFGVPNLAVAAPVLAMGVPGSGGSCVQRLLGPLKLDLAALVFGCCGICGGSCFLVRRN